MMGSIVQKLGSALVCLALAGTAGAATPSGDASAGGMLGFTVAGATQQRTLEQRFDSLLSADEMRNWMKRMASGPNQVGAPHNKANAEWVLAQFKKWGWNAHIEKFEVIYPTPKQELVELVAPTHFKAKLHEPPIEGDPTSTLPGVLPPYNSYGADGDVTAGLVYVNYGMPDDYKQLARLGVSVKGKIVIVRYGGGWRGLKPRLAYDHGAVGCLIYSDPADDGYFVGETYPNGPTRPADAVQRGTVSNQVQNYPGDPTSPGHAPVPGAKHVAVKDAKPIQKIPVLPISYADATPLLQALQGPVAPKNWRGALPFTYHVGPGPAKVHMLVESNWDLTPLYDVIAMLPGSGNPDRWVVRGNHRDGWVFGAQDPLSGTVAMLGEAKALGALYRQGWRPDRTLVYASWDGEESGLLGSTAWAEAHAKELQRKAIMYINTDANGRGFLSASGSPSLQHLLNQVADEVPDPETDASVGQRLRASLNVASAQPDARPAIKHKAKLAANGADIPLGVLGGGSDHSTFVNHLGIASLAIGFRGESLPGVYHSRYDSFTHFSRFVDPTFEYEVALAKVVGRLATRVADAKVLPLRFADLGEALVRDTDQLHQQIQSERKAAETQHKLLDAGAYKQAADPVHPTLPPARLSSVPQIDLGALDTAVQKLRASAKAYEKAYAARAAAGLDIPAKQLRQINQMIATMQRHMLAPEGLPDRGWYKNVYQAPGIFTGYGAFTLPAVHQALTVRDWQTAAQNADFTATVLDQYRAQLDKLTAALQ